jgi:4'-phosphopantetheinyl transferase
MKRDWIEVDDWPTLPAGEVHVWLVHVPDVRARLQELGALLSPDERDRVARFKFEKHRERAQVSRGVLRLLLGHYTGRDARPLVFSYNPHGKPAMTGHNVHFNASHSGDYVAFAFTRVAIVGVDIEQIRENMTEHEAIAERYFATREKDQLRALPEGERLHGFFQLWTRKEAFIKARGNGLFSDLARFETALDGSRVVSVDGVLADDWWMSPLPDVTGYAGTVAVNAGSCTPRFWQWK